MTQKTKNYALKSRVTEAANLRLRSQPLTLPTDQLETRIRVYPPPPPPIFWYGLFNVIIAEKIRRFFLSEIQDGGRKNGSGINF